MKQAILSIFLLSSIITQAQKIPLYLRADFGRSNVKTSSGKGSFKFATAVGVETFLNFLNLEKDVDLSINPNLSLLRTGYQPQAGGDVVVNYISLGLPVSIVFGAEEGGFNFGAGPFFNFVRSGKFRSYSIDDYRPMKFGNTTDDNRTTTDAGILFKGAVRVKKLYIGLQNNIGLSNLIPKDRITNGSYIKSRNFLFYMAYRLGK
ncbi:MAG: hypothetical protein V4556_02075 [Bacteroidota bacterium]